MTVCVKTWAEEKKERRDGNGWESRQKREKDEEKHKEKKKKKKLGARDKDISKG